MPVPLTPVAPVGTPSVISTNTYLTLANRTYLQDGSFVLIREVGDATSAMFDTYAQRYTANGTAIGAEFKVNTTTAAARAGTGCC